eukprot:gene22484-8974_t
MAARTPQVPTMKFRIFGGLDCPDFILAEIAAVSKISTDNMKLLANG